MKTFQKAKDGSPQTYPEMSADDDCEDFGHRVIIEGIHADNVEVTEESRSHVISTSPWWSHGTEELNVL